jgi:hypothetical protein
MLIPLAEEKVLYADDQGNWYFEQVRKGKAQKSHAVNQDFLTVEELEYGEGRQQEKK